jgi:hypothetical protein
MEKLIGREFAEMMFDSAPVAAVMEGHHCTPSFSFMQLVWRRSLSRVSGRSMVVTAEFEGSNRRGGGRLAEAVGAGGPDAAHRQAELIANLLVGDWRICDEQGEKGTMALRQLGKPVPHSSSALCMQHPGIDLAAAEGRSQR